MLFDSILLIVVSTRIYFDDIIPYFCGAKVYDVGKRFKWRVVVYFGPTDKSAIEPSSVVFAGSYQRNTCWIEEP